MDWLGNIDQAIDSLDGRRSPFSFSTGKRVSGIHLLPSEISAADYDYYCLAEDPEGHTYHNVGKKRGNEYRPDGAVELRKERR